VHGYAAPVEWARRFSYVLIVMLFVAGCGSSSAATSSHSSTDKPKLTLRSLVRGLNSQLQPSRFAIVRRFANGNANVGSSDHTYGHFFIEFVPSGIHGASWPEKKGSIPIWPHGFAGGYVSYGTGNGIGLCDYVKEYGKEVFIVYTFHANEIGCKVGNATPKGSSWDSVSHALTTITSPTG